MSIHSSLEAGVHAFQSGNYKQAINLLEKALEADPQQPDLQYWLVKAYQQFNSEQLEKPQLLANAQNHLSKQTINYAATTPVVTTATKKYVANILKIQSILLAIALVLLPLLVVTGLSYGFINQKISLHNLEICIAVTALLSCAIAIAIANWLANPIIEAIANLRRLVQTELDTPLDMKGANQINILVNQVAELHKAEQDKLQQQVNLICQILNNIAAGKLELRIPNLEANTPLQYLALNINKTTAQFEKVFTDLKNQQKALDVSAIVSITDKKGLITYTNNKFSEISGYTREELLGQNHRIVNSGYHPPEFFVDLWNTISSGKAWRGEIKNKRKNGAFYWVDSSIMPLIDTQGQISGYIGIRFDITERKEAEERLQTLAIEQERLVQEIKNRQSVLDEAAIVSEADLKGNIIFVNAKFCEISGYSPEELIGKNHRIVNSSHHPKQFFIELWTTVSSGRIWKGEIKNRRKDGSYYWVDSTIAPVFDSQGYIIKYVGIRFDITERKEAEERLTALAGEQERLVQEIKNRQNVLDEAAIVTETDRKGNIIFVNDKFCEISGYSSEELLGKNHRIVNSDYHSKEFFTNFWATISSGRIWKGEIRNRRKNGSYYWVDSTVAPIFNAEGKIVKYIGIRFDITEQKEAAERLGKLAEDRKLEAESLTQQVVKLLGEIKGAARGDLTVKAQVTNDILGSVADSFNYLIGSLRKVVNNIQEASLQVNQATTDSIGGTRELADKARNQALQIEQILRQLERMINSIKDVSEAAKRAEEVAQQAAETAEQGGKAVDRTVDGINDLRQTIAETSKMMKRLGEGSQQIGKIVTSISQIASQTNLLALNATIEAARAGEQGQGFAVVADEVRKLAERSASATEEISEIVRTIQEEISRVMGAMESGTQQVVEGTKIAAEAKTNLNAIIEVSREINGLVQNITRASQKQNISAEDISGSVKQVSTISTTTAKKAEDLTNSLDGLAVVANKLQSSVANFRSQ